MNKVICCLRKVDESVNCDKLGLILEHFHTKLQVDAAYIFV